MLLITVSNGIHFLQYRLLIIEKNVSEITYAIRPPRGLRNKIPLWFSNDPHARGTTHLTSKHFFVHKGIYLWEKTFAAIPL